MKRVLCPFSHGERYLPVYMPPWVWWEVAYPGIYTLYTPWVHRPPYPARLRTPRTAAV